MNNTNKPQTVESIKQEICELTDRLCLLRFVRWCTAMELERLEDLLDKKEV